MRGYFGFPSFFNVLGRWKVTLVRIFLAFFLKVVPDLTNLATLAIGCYFFFCLLYQLSLDLVQEWLAENAKESILGQDMSISGIATYQPFDGLMELKVAVVGFMSQVMDKLVSFKSAW
ncbi:unnamed protein product [Coffea canephora]|uniref:Uncharacterized protein n=1 Tax=Coffea canephora TaxID=49390 RepID=A0A068V6P9_COFCA|nr:unnamed protein product [Coffea canephora]CDP16514.1 unnamed protein product [Coffea canephora]